LTKTGKSVLEEEQHWEEGGGSKFKPNDKLSD